MSNETPTPQAETSPEGSSACSGWVIPHPGSLEPVECASFEEAMERWFEGFNIPRRRLPDGTLESFDVGYARVGRYLRGAV